MQLWFAQLNECREENSITIYIFIINFFSPVLLFLAFILYFFWFCIVNCSPLSCIPGMEDIDYIIYGYENVWMDSFSAAAAAAAVAAAAADEST